MKLAIFCVFVFFSSLSGCREVAPDLGIQFKLIKRTLSNGLTVILVEDHTVPLVSYQTWFRVGSVDEYPGITGISHMFEHLMYKGTPKYGPKQFFQELEMRGAEVNAYTTRDSTVYYENFGKDLLEKVIDMESDRLANLTLSDDLLNVERMVVLEERRLRTDSSPEGKMQEALWQLSYRRHPYQWPVIGLTGDVMRITTAQLVEHFKTYYQPANATLVVVGDFTPENAWYLIKKYYDKIPSQSAPTRNIPIEPEQQEERRLVIRQDVGSERFAQAYHITSAVEDDSYALDVLSNILFEGTSARAFRRLVDEKDLVVNIAGSSYTPAYPGLFLISATLKGKVSSAVAEAELDRVIGKVQGNGVTDDEVRIAVKQLTVQLVDSVRTHQGLGQLIGTVQSIFGGTDRILSDVAKYLKVTPQDVKRVALKYLNPNNRSVVNLVPMGTTSGATSGAASGATSGKI